MDKTRNLNEIDMRDSDQKWLIHFNYNLFSCSAVWLQTGLCCRCAPSASVQVHNTMGSNFKVCIKLLYSLILLAIIKLFNASSCKFISWMKCGTPLKGGRNVVLWMQPMPERLESILHSLFSFLWYLLIACKMNIKYLHVLS